MENPEFSPINLDLHSDLCIKFRADYSFICSFGTDKPFWEDDGNGDARYIEWLKSRSSRRYGTFHIWLNGRIIGQMELGERNSKEDFGYVHLYYLIPECRGNGYAKYLLSHS